MQNEPTQAEAAFGGPVGDPIGTDLSRLQKEAEVACAKKQETVKAIKDMQQTLKAIEALETTLKRAMAELKEVTKCEQKTVLPKRQRVCQ